MSNRQQYSDPEQCKKCGGQCCYIYRNVKDGGTKDDNKLSEEWVAMWDDAFKESGAIKITPLFDPLLANLNDKEDLRLELKARGLDSQKCQYCNIDGCILPWDLRPKSCREYRCPKWASDFSKNTEYLRGSKCQTNPI